MKKFFASSILPLLGGAMLLSAGLFACDTEEPDLPRLEFHAAMPKEVTVGDTTDPLLTVRIFADARGREQKTGDYRNFVFRSTDTTVLKVEEDRRLLGLKAGTASVTARDLAGGGSATRTAAAVTIKP